MKLWLLDADVIIKFLELEIFDKLVSMHEIHVSTTVIREVQFFYKNGQRSNDNKVFVNFRSQYVGPGRVTETDATSDEVKAVVNQLPPLKRKAIDPGELESLAVLVREESLTMCSFDVAAIKALPFLQVADRAISAEQLLKSSGFTLSPGDKLDPRLTESYFRNNLSQGQKDFILGM